MTSCLRRQSRPDGLALAEIGLPMRSRGLAADDLVRVMIVAGCRPGSFVGLFAAGWFAVRPGALSISVAICCGMVGSSARSLPVDGAQDPP